MRIVVVLSCLAAAGCGSPPPSSRSISRVAGGGHFAAGWSGWDSVGVAIDRDTAPALATRNGTPYVFFRDTSGGVVTGPP